MSTVAQISANRENSKSSTGPLNETGKETVSANSVKHGLSGAKHTILSYERAEYEKCLAEYLAHYKPAGPEEHRLISNIAANAVRIRRAHSMEAVLFEQAIAEKADKEDAADPIVAQAQAWNDASKGLQRIGLYTHRIQRTIDKDAARLDALQSARKAAYAKAQEEAILLCKLNFATGHKFDPASHFPPDGDFGGFAYSDHDLAQVIARANRLEEARARFAPTQKTPELTMRDLEALIG